MRLPFSTGFTAEAARFQWRLLGVLAMVVFVTVGAVLWVARHNIAVEEEHRRETEFQVSLALLRHARQYRHEALVERCRILATKSRIQASLEDGAEDLLYPSARDELRDLLGTPSENDTPAGLGRRTARFYRFLDATGRLVGTHSDAAAGELSPAEEKKLSLPSIPDAPQFGYIRLQYTEQSEELLEVIVVPILSNVTGRKLAALVLGFEPQHLEGIADGTAFTNGIWIGNRLHLVTDEPVMSTGLIQKMEDWLKAGIAQSGRVRLETAEESWLVFAQSIDTGVLYATAFEVCAFPLRDMLARQRTLGWRVMGLGVVVLLLGLMLSYALSYRLSAPVEELAHDSQEQRTRRVQAEAALKITSGELDRAARFSANASHQLKTPVVVLRAGLEMLQARGVHNDAERQEIEMLIHQTYRISSVIEDLLLLSRMDAGHLKLTITAVNLSELIAAVLDDISAMPTDNEFTVEQDCPPDLYIAGEKRYTALILQNLLENARKYNRPAGSIRLTTRTTDEEVLLTVGNTVRRAIPPETQAQIFERFHRGSQGENIPGHGLGLNLARELARLHQGDLKLVRSDGDWTEFLVSFRRAPLQPEAGG